MMNVDWGWLKQRAQEMTITHLAVAAGLALMVSAALLWLNYTLPLQTRAAELQRALADHKTPSVVRRTEISAGGLSDGDAGLPQFYRHFPSMKNLPNLLRIVYREAEGQGLLLAEGSYQLVPLKDTHLAAYQMSLPVKGSYTQVRQFIAQLLQALPTMAVDELHFARDDITSARLEAKIRLTLYLRDPLSFIVSPSILK